MFCEVRVTKPAQTPKKQNGSGVNIDRHQKNTHKEKQTFQQLWAHFWVVAGFFVFLCLCRFGVSSGLVLFVFFWCLPMFCHLWSQSHQTCKGTKKHKTNKVEVEDTSTGTKKNTNFPATIGPLLDRCWEMWISFFLCLCRFGASSGLVFFSFFGACQCFFLIYVTSRSW